MLSSSSGTGRWLYIFLSSIDMDHEMDIDKAFRILGLPIDASEDDIKRAYRNLTNTTHPENPHRDSDKCKVLNLAKERAIAYSKIKYAVIPVNSRVMSQNIRRALTLYTGFYASEKAYAIHRRASRLINTLKWLALTFGGISGAIAIMKEQVAKIPGVNSETLNSLNIGLVPLALLSGTIGFLLQMLISYNRRGIEAYLDRISDKKECAYTLAELLGYEDKARISENDLANHTLVSEIIPFLSLFKSLLTRQELTRVVLAKAVEHGLLVPEENEQITPSYTQTYKLDFRHRSLSE